MKKQLRPFLVEVKRGATRSAFTVKHTIRDIVRKAEAAPFRHAQSQTLDRYAEQGTGRIPSSMVEDPPTPDILIPEPHDLPKRRGKALGSKNKPETHLPPIAWRKTCQRRPEGLLEPI